ncbi:cytochrome c/FTR1 family iron permease [bacterium]|nr:cytochrome c/FTR1 family iron permease [bacterium]
MRRLNFISIALLISSVMAQAASSERSPRFLVHLLDYLAKDYGGAVAHGKVLSESEYHEQVEFSRSALETNQELAETRAAPEIATKLKSLNQLIARKADAEQVSRLAREIQIKVIEVARLEVAPVRWPSLQRGKQIFAQNCVACHGATGAGDGLAGKSLDPKPANFLDDHMKELSPFQAFNTIRLGVPGTGMPPFHTLSDKEAWDVAFYIVSLRYGQASAQAKKIRGLETITLKEAATLSDEKLGEVLSSKNREERAQVIASLRSRSDDDDTGGGSLTIASTQLDEAVKDYEAGQIDSAKTNALKAYLEGIEPVEPKLKASDPDTVANLETKMADVRSAIERKAPLSDIQAKVVVAKSEIEAARRLLSSSEMSPWIAFMAAAAILLREGFEAVLVIIALLGVIRASGSKKAAAWVHGGWISALGLGAIAWIFSGWLMGISGAQRETLEGATSLFAVAVLLFVGFWLHSQTEIGRWKAFIHGKVQRALDGKNLWALASISFVAVFREAFETVLFLRAIWLEGGDGIKIAMTAGVLSSLALVIAMAWAILKYSAKLPIRRLFEASALVMAALALILTGKGLHAFQETGTLSVTSTPGALHLTLLGVYPTWETLVSQVAVLALVLILWAYGKRPSGRGATLTSQAAES